MYKGVDVSQWQGTIDWKKVAASGIEFAIIRCAKQDLSVDPFFEKNYAGAVSNGLAVGVYKYSYATTVEESAEEAMATLEAIKGKEFGAKVWLDLEDKCQQNLDKELLYEIVKVWLELVEKAGYEVGIYCNQYWYKSILTDKIKALTKNFWIAKWSDNKPELGELAWQYSAEGKVDGIKGNADMNYYYGEFDAITKEENKLILLPMNEIVAEVVAGKWGDGSARKEALEAAGYDYESVQSAVNAYFDNQSKVEKKPVKAKFSKGNIVVVKNAVQYDNGQKFKCWYTTYEVLQVGEDEDINRIVIGKGNVITAAVHADNLELATQVSTSDLVPGDKVKVKKAIQYDNGKSFKLYYPIYDVIAVGKDEKSQRIVIGKGAVKTAAVHRDNLQKV